MARRGYALRIGTVFGRAATDPPTQDYASPFGVKGTRELPHHIVRTVFDKTFTTDETDDSCGATIELGQAHLKNSPAGDTSVYEFMNVGD